MGPPAARGGAGPGSSPGQPPRPEGVYLARAIRRIDWRRLGLIALGLALFAGFALAPSPAPAVDPHGAEFPLSREGRAALGLFLLAVIWWAFEVIPIGVTSVAIAALQALCLLRPVRAVFTDFMDPAVWFILASITLGLAFSKTGLTQRFLYRMLCLVGERTRLIYLGCFAMTGAMTLLMSHTAVAAAVYPLFMAVYSLYDDEGRPTRFGKGLFVGMAFVAGAGSVGTLLGAARGVVALGFFRAMTGADISFFRFSLYMLPLGWTMILLLWLLILLLFPPEEKAIPGLKDRARTLHSRLGPMSRAEKLTLAIVLLALALLVAGPFVPALSHLDKSAVLLLATLLLFLFNILEVKDLESVSWNIALLFGGAMSLGFCLWDTGAARFLGVALVGIAGTAPWFAFVMAAAAFVLLATNGVINVAVLALALPVLLVMAPYVGAPPEVVLFACLAAAGMPFMLLVGAAPNAIAYESRQFTAREFFLSGVPASVLLLVVLAVFVRFVWQGPP